MTIVGKKKVGRPNEINQLGILFDLYRYRTLTVQQLKKVHFKGKESSVYVILHRMKKEGLVEAITRSKDGGKRLMACYFITGRGITRLREAGLVKKARRAVDNKPDERKIPYLVDTNELYVQLHEKGYELIDAREWKSRFEMDRNAMVKSGLKAPDGREYAVYIFETDVDEERTVKRFKQELKNNIQTGRFLVLFKGIRAYNKLKKNLKAKELSYIELNLLPYGFGLKKLHSFPTQSQFVNLFTKYGSVRDNELANSSTSHFSDYILTTTSGEEFYICNYLLCNEIARYYLNHYNNDHFRSDGRKVKVFCWKETEEKLSSMRDQFKQYPHVGFTVLNHNT